LEAIAVQSHLILMIYLVSFVALMLTILTELKVHVFISVNFYKNGTC